MDRETFEKLRQENWDRIILKLTRFASMRMKKLSWKYGQKHEGISKGLEAGDVALSAVASLLSEKRRWDRGKDPDLMKYLFSVVNSEVSHFYESKEYQTTERFAENEEGEELIPLSVDPEVLGDFGDPEEILLKKEEDQRGDELYDQLLDFVKDDDELGEMILSIREGAAKPREIAEMLRVETEEVYARKKRLKRRYREFENMRREGIINGGQIAKRRRELEEPRESL